MRGVAQAAVPASSSRAAALPARALAPVGDVCEEGGNMDEAREHAVRALEMDRDIWKGDELLLELMRVGTKKGY